MDTFILPSKPDMKKPLTQKQYVDKVGGVCPYCQSTDIEGEHFEVDGGSAWQEVHCNDCDAYWTDLYKLVGYEKIY